MEKTLKQQYKKYFEKSLNNKMKELNTIENKIIDINLFLDEKTYFFNFRNFSIGYNFENSIKYLKNNFNEFLDILKIKNFYEKEIKRIEKEIEELENITKLEFSKWFK